MDKKPKQSAPNGPSVTPLSGLNKRQQVARANNMMFVWVAAASAVVALSLVLLQFLVKQAFFNQKIINEKSATNRTVEQNISNAATLKENVDKLIADENLSSVKANDGDNNLQVVLDALPTKGDTTSFANSLYSQIIGPVGIKIDSVTTGATDALTTDTSGMVAVETVPGVAPTPQPLPFVLTTTGNVVQTNAMFMNLEKTIRPINPKTITIRVADGLLTTSVTGETYYLPASTVDLGKKTVKP